MTGNRNVNESLTRSRFVARIVAAFSILLAFAIGVVVGKPAHVRKPPAEKNSTYETRMAQSDLAACRRKLAARSKAAAIASASAERVKRDAPELAAPIDALENELEECKTRDILVKADVCGSSDRYSILMSALMHGAKSCVDKVGLGDFIVGNYDKCPEFDDAPYDWAADDYDLSEAERKKVTNAAYTHKRLNKETLAGLGRFVMRGCIQKYGEPHP